MKEFVSAVKAHEAEAEEQVEWLEFKQDGRVCHAARPETGQIAYLAATTHKRAPFRDQMAGAINFAMSIFDEDTASYLSDKLLDRNDPFDLSDLQGILSWVVEEWSARPTRESSDSSATPSSTGPSSTPTTEEPISSPFVATGS